MADNDDKMYSGDLQGRPCLQATMMGCGVCMCGDMIGVDMIDADSITIVHGHLDIEAAEFFHHMYGEAIAEAKARQPGNSN